MKTIKQILWLILFFSITLIANAQPLPPSGVLPETLIVGYVSSQTVTTQAVSNISTTSATGNGNITALGSTNPTAHGVCWNTTGTPTTADNATDEGAASATGAFTSAMTGLLPNTMYYVRAYATNTEGTVYGSQVSFTTLNGTVFDFESSVTGIGTKTVQQTNSGETLIVNATDYNLLDATTSTTGFALSGSKSVSTDFTGAGGFESSLNFSASGSKAFDVVSLLLANYDGDTETIVLTSSKGTATFSVDGNATTLNVAAHANASYFQQITSFTITENTSPETENGYALVFDDIILNNFTTPSTVTTQAVSSIATTTATGNGNITALGSTNPTAHGVCWNTTGTPTISDSKVDNGAASATGAFTSAMTSLLPNTTYYVRAYATNTAGTSYGTQVNFTTDPLAPTVTTQAVSSISTTTATGNGNITVLGVPNPTAHGVCWNTTGTPTTADNATDEGAASATGAFTSAMTSLLPNTTYYVRAYATNAAGTVYGADQSFTTIGTTPNALEFDGTDDYVTTGAGLVNFANDMTVEAWFSTTNTTGYNSITTIEKTASGTNDFLQILTNSAGNIYLDDANNANIITTTESYNDGKWHHVAFVRDATAKTIYLYVDGLLKGSSTYTYSGAVNADHELRFGNSEYNGGSYQMDGMIDEIRIWNDVRTLTEIRDNLRDTLVGNEANLVGYYRFDEVSGTTLPDLTSGGNDGTLVNMDDADWVSSGAFIIPQTATEITDTTDVSFTANWEINYSATKYYLDVSTASDFSTFVSGYENLEVAGQSTLSQSVTGLTANTTYYCRVRAYNGDAALTSGNSNTLTVTTFKTLQTITFPAVTAKTYGDAAFTLGDATTDEGLTVTYTATDPTVLSITGNTATILKAGSTDVTATQTGDATHSAATPVVRTVTINTRAITITADPKAKTYGDADPTLTAQVTAGTIVSGDAATGSLTRETGNNVGKYEITQNSYTYGTNYAETFVTDSLSISTRAITITADPKVKTYGDADPTLTAQVTAGTIVSGDAATGSLTRETGDNVGKYEITQNSYTYGTNYAETFVTDSLSISTRAITITADPKVKTYGDADPTLTAQVTAGTIVSGDAATGSLTRETGDNVGKYEITQNSYTYGTNYAETFVTDSLSISTRAITITADPKAKTYGDADPTLTAQVTAGTIVSGDAATGSLTRETGDNVGKYEITQNSYTYGTNYAETFVTDSLSISTRAITITADPKAKTYGDADPTLTAQVTAGTIVSGDAATGSLTRETGNNVGKYEITQNSYTYGTNYAETFVTDSLSISTRAITITADPKVKTYGDADPTLTAQVTAGTIVSGDAATGSLTRETGDNVGKYEITQNSYTYGTNYAETFVTDSLSISTRAITITADPKAKTYGDADPTLTAQVTAGTIVSGDAATGSLTRETGDNVGKYEITQNSYTYGTNYAETFVTDSLSISTRAITITADPKAKTYGDADPTLTAQVTAGTIVSGDAATGSLTRETGDNVGKYEITQNSYTYGTNYAETFVTDSLSISTRAITITADPKAKTYGDADPTLTAQVTAGTIVSGDAATGSLTRETGDNVGKYEITQNSYTYGTNYAETFVTDSLSISTRAITITADPKVKTYGDADPTLTAQVTAGTIVSGDAATGSLTRETGDNVGKYEITQNSYTYGTNYAETFVTDSLSISTRAITITADPKVKTYGDADPTLTAQVTAGTIVSGDAATGSLTRETGDNVGKYEITQNSYTYGTNYAETFVTDSLSISTRAITITADPKAKTYGDIDPALTAQVTAGTIVSGDAATGSLTRETGNNVGKYEITQNSYTYGTNYAETFVTDSLSISTRAITITADPKAKTYGDADPTLTAQVTAGTIVSGDAATGSLTRESGNNVGKYEITQNSYTYGTNYAETFVTDSLSISTRAITITADPKAKTYGDADPTLTAQVTAGTIVSGDAATGSLTRETGNNVGKYEITQNSYTYGTNYAETFVTDSLSISTRAITITADPKAKTYGDADPTLTAQVTATIVSGDAATGSLTRETGDNVGKYEITQNSYTYGTNYAETFVTDSLSISTRAITITADPKAKTYGDADPTLTAQVTAGTIVSGDAATGSLTRESGNNVGKYEITQNSYTYGTNYAETFVTDSLSISTRAITITADPKAKTYGDADPTLTAQVTAGTIVSGDAATGSLTRETGNNVGKYEITQNSYTYGTNYAETFVTDSLEISTKQLVVNSPSLTLQKTYDSNASAQITAGSFTNLESGDVVNLNVTANYDNANVGTAKTITVTYTIDGADAANYITPTIYQVNNGVIEARQLTISEPNVVNNKIYDGNDTARIVQLGTLAGTVGTDDVTISAVATYDNTTTGANKTITVVYTLSGTGASNYIAPASYVITGAKISEEITLSNEIIVPLSGGCQNDSVYVEYSITSGTPTQYQIIFDSEAQAAGFVNEGYQNLPSTDFIDSVFINVPSSMIEGVYHAQLQLKNELNIESDPYPFTFTINLDKKYIVSKFDDVVLCDNSSNRFTSYQWYKDGAAIFGATAQFYNDPNGLNGTYYVEVNTTDAKTLRTCEQTHSNPSFRKAELTVYPNPAVSTDDINITISGIESEEITNAEMDIYSTAGALVYTTDKVSVNNKVQLPIGEYVGVVKVSGKDRFNFKVVVGK